MRRSAAFIAALLLACPALGQSAPASDVPGGCVWPTATPQTQTHHTWPSRTRAVFVLDTSGSMRGIGDGKADIFGAVKASINAYVRQYQPDRVELLTFDSGLRSRQGFDQPAGTPAWNAALGALRADGQNTFLYRSMRAALQPLVGADTYVTTVFVLTDGIDNERGGASGGRASSAAQALEAFTGRGPFDRLHYLALGTGIPPQARRALEDSPYAAGLTVPVGQVPDLGQVAGGGGLVTVTDPQRVPAPFPDGAALTLHAPSLGNTVRLAQPQAQSGLTRLEVSGPVPYGALALLCAARPATQADQVAPKAPQVLLRLALAGAQPIIWLNPGADLGLRTGEGVVLRYRAPRGVKLDGASVGGALLGVQAELYRQASAQEFTVRLVNLGLGAGAQARATLLLPGAPPLNLPVVRGLASGPGAGVAAQAGPVSSNPVSSSPVSGSPVSGSAVATPPGTGGTSLEGKARFPRRLAWLLAGLAGLVLLVLVLLRPRRRVSPVSRVSRTDPSVPTISGLEYSEDRTLSLVSAAGHIIGVPTPLGGAFDLGHIARVPLLSGLRGEQHRDGLQMIKVPSDLELSQGTRLLRDGDVVRPGTLLGVAVARPDRGPHLPLGTLAGLGLPLRLHCEDLTVRAVGPYGDHALDLPPGLTDLGAAFQAPVLRGLKVSTSSLKVLLVEVPHTLTLRLTGENAPLRPGTYLPPVALLDLPDE